MNKDSAKIIIAENQKLILGVKFYPRDYQFDEHLNYVLVGLRRAGKSYLLYQQIHTLLQQGHDITEMLYFNFEDDRLDSLTTEDLNLIKTAYEEMFDCKPFVFLDEVQNVDGWERFARRLADQKYRVFITGSNAKMLSSQIATTLGGRYMIKEVFPYSFKEFLLTKNININEKNAIYDYRKEILKFLESYFTFGGLPESVEVQDKRNWLSNLFNKVFFGDLIARYNIRNTEALKTLIRKLAENIKQPSSYSRLANIISSIGKKINTETISDYLRRLNESWLILPVENIVAKLADKVTNKKYYFIDNGVLNLFLLDSKTSLLENIVAVSLSKRYPGELFYYMSGVEVDFFVRSQNTAIQVSYSIAAPETREREIGALAEIERHLSPSRLIIITKDEEDILETATGKKVEVVPLWKFLLETT
ncbi:MAG: ATP-binding protein [Bacteroidales bacterium]|nr:ATP-binding protein [Bacteroidales bacterium]MBQ5540064.1 ATP-binding protein [Bacteroidales bacterium]